MADAFGAGFTKGKQGVETLSHTKVSVPDLEHRQPNSPTACAKIIMSSNKQMPGTSTVIPTTVRASCTLLFRDSSLSLKGSHRPSLSRAVVVFHGHVENVRNRKR